MPLDPPPQRSPKPRKLTGNVRSNNVAVSADNKELLIVAGFTIAISDAVPKPTYKIEMRNDLLKALLSVSFIYL